MTITFETRIHVLCRNLPQSFVATQDARWNEVHGPDAEIPDILVEVEFSPGYDEPANLSGHPDSWTPAGGEAPEILNVTILETGDEILCSLPAVIVRDLVFKAEQDLESLADDGGW